MKKPKSKMMLLMIISCSQSRKFILIWKEMKN